MHERQTMAELGLFSTGQLGRFSPASREQGVNSRQIFWGILTAGLAGVATHAVATGYIYSGHAAVYRATDPGPYWIGVVITVATALIAATMFVRNDPSD
jgi:anti-sigma-K factor RskA